LALPLLLADAVDDLPLSRAILGPVDAEIQRSQLNVRGQPLRQIPLDLLEILDGSLDISLRLLDSSQFIAG